MNAAVATRLADALDTFLLEARRTSRARAIDRAVRRLERLLGHAFDVQGKAFLRHLGALKPQFPEVREAIRNEDWEPLLDAAFRATRKLFADALQRAVELALQAGAEAAIAEFGVPLDFSLENPRAVAYLLDYGAERVTMIEQTTRDAIRSILVQAADEGWSYDRAARAISQRFTEFRVGQPQQHVRSRAHLVAMTEIGDAYEHGNLLAAQAIADGGSTVEKSWLTAGDQRVSDGCRDNAAAGWIALDADFPSGHQRPLRHPGCRCALLTRVAP